MQTFADGLSSAFDDQAGEPRVFQVTYHNQVCLHADREADDLVPVVPLDQVTYRVERGQHIARNRFAQFGKAGIQCPFVSLLLAFHIVVRLKIQRRLKSALAG